MKYHKNVNGIALIQVLLITGVLSVLALFLTYTAKEQVTMAQWVDDKASALIALHSTESELMFSLLTNSKFTQLGSGQPPQNLDEISSNWNFFAKPFTVKELVTISIQDQAGLIHAQYPNRDMLIKLLLSQNMSLPEANALADSLLDWQDIDSIPRLNGAELFKYKGNIRNGNVPNVHDFLFVNKVTPEILKLLIKNSTIHKNRAYNPMNSPKILLAAITSKQVAEQVVVLRESKQLTKAQFIELTGINETDRITFYDSNNLAIDLTATVGESKVNKKIIIRLAPYATAGKRPIDILSNRG